ncbi:hydroxyisourate hydrolase [Micromonospora sp. CPCC 206060]|uniref:hydroxyisourate hydrolase n=1 Tax=Micromonospora sp. CPCC 206060 TaxID=3122406 RepID=UPI002FF2764F
MSVSAQVLDGIYGRPAVGIRARLERTAEAGWEHISTAETDTDGQINEWTREQMEGGPYRIVFDSDRYFACLGIDAAYPEIAVIFRARSGARTCHIQVLLTPYSYSMYFGTRA